jgi:hypothetical protein
VHSGVLQKHKWEMCDTLDKESWGIRRAMTSDAVLTIEQIIFNLVSVVRYVNICFSERVFL